VVNLVKSVVSSHGIVNRLPSSITTESSHDSSPTGNERTQGKSQSASTFSRLKFNQDLSVEQEASMEAEGEVKSQEEQVRGVGLFYRQEDLSPMVVSSIWS
jgi:hypothetical protein